MPTEAATVSVFPDHFETFPVTKLDSLHDLWRQLYLLAADESIDFRQYRPEIYVGSNVIAIERIKKNG